VEAVVFLVLTDIDISKLESFVSLKAPGSYTRGILKFEEVREAKFDRPKVCEVFYV